MLWLVRSNCVLTKKKVLFLTMGPPIEPPNWLRLNSGLRAGSKKLRASKLSLRWNS